MRSTNTKWSLRVSWLVWINLMLLFFGQHVEAKIGYFWHISDLHLDSAYSTKGDATKNCWQKDPRQTNSASRQPGKFGDYMCDSPWSLLESATQAMKSRQGDNVEFVLWTGDGLSHSTRRLIESHRLDLLRNITDLLGRTFSSQFVFPVLGHEDTQGNSFRRLGELWRHWLPSEALQTFEKGGYYTIEQTKSRLRIIALNTNFMRHDIKYSQTHSAAVRQRPSSMNAGSNGGGSSSDSSSEYNSHNYNYGSHHGQHSRQSNGGGVGYGERGYWSIGGTNGGGTVSALSGSENHEAQKQWDWLEEVLDKSSRNKETVYIVGHIPPGSDERQVGILTNGHTTFSEKNNLRYLRLVRKYSSIILGQFFGHLHSDSFRIIYNELGKPVSWMMIAPSIAPRKANVGSNNPAMRLYKFDTDTGQVLDYTQYFLDLDQANALGEAVWQPEYNLTTQYFGSNEVTAVALHNLADRFTNIENPMFAKYYRANSVRYATPACEGVCSLNHYCAITRVDYHEFRQCLETAASALASSSKSSGSTISRLTLILSVFAAFSRSPRRRLLVDWFHHLTVTIPRGCVAALIKSAIRSANGIVAHCLVGLWLMLGVTATLRIPSTAAPSSTAPLIAARKSRRCSAAVLHQPLIRRYRILINLVRASVMRWIGVAAMTLPGMGVWRPSVDAGRIGRVGFAETQHSNNNTSIDVTEFDRSMAPHQSLRATWTTTMGPTTTTTTMLLATTATTITKGSANTNIICQSLVNDTTTSVCVKTRRNRGLPTNGGSPHSLAQTNRLAYIHKHA